MQLGDFDFDLPEDRIAQAPACPRDHAKLLHVAAEGLHDRHVFDLPGLLRPGDVMVFNDTKVIPARLYGRRGDLKVEILLDRPEDDAGAWRAFAHPRRKLKDGQRIVFAEGFSCVVEGRYPEGTVTIRFDCSPAELDKLLRLHGHMPLPPYIKRGDETGDEASYQTVYARHEGAVAAPTAGLHFTPDLLQKIESGGVELLHVTLHVGAGTFAPVRSENIADHIMHAERGIVSAETAARLNAAKAEGRRIVAVGTTSLRLLESAAREDGTVWPFAGQTSIFMTPGYRFRTADLLMTNFHLPKTTLFMLVSAFSGLERMKAAYAHAAANGYRFYSYGDACLLERVDP